MPSLKDLIANSIKQNLGSQKSQLSHSVAGDLQGLKQNTSNLVAQPVNNLVNAVNKGVKSTIADAMSGNFSNLSNDVGGIFKAFSNLSGPTAPSEMGVPAANNAGNGHVLAGALARPDALLSFNWFCDLPTITSGGSTYQLPWYYVEDAQTTFRTIETRSIFRQGRHKHYVSGFNVNNLNLTFYADNLGLSKIYLSLWEDLIIAPTTQKTWAAAGGGVGPAANYKKDIKVYVSDTAKKIHYILVYKECFPISIQPYNFDSGTSTRIMLHVEFSVGDVFLQTETTQAEYDKPVPTPQSAGAGYNAAKDSAAADITPTSPTVLAQESIINQGG